MIDLRSDTVTVPTDGMREAIARAIVGDDVFGEDPATNELQEYIAKLLDKEAALFVTSGVMGNQICIAAQTQPGDEVIVESDSHIFYYETAAPSIISRVQLRDLKSTIGAMDLNEIESSVRSSEYYFPRTSMICIENTHNRHGGAIIALDYIKEVKKTADTHNLIIHCDGARLWHACIATDISPANYVRQFDSVSVCLSKGLGAPVGSVIAGKKEFIEKARKWRKILGGGMRQSGILAAAGLYALRNHLPLLEFDHLNARLFSEIISESEFIAINLENIVTNIVVFDLSEKIELLAFIEECKKNGLLIIPVGKNSIRAVFHFQINENMAIMAGNIIKFAIHNLAK